ncbi:MAG: M48 family metallopeptidase [Alphaproteobacteria bacterium]
MAKAARTVPLSMETLAVHGQTVPFSVRINPRARRVIIKVDPVERAVILVIPRPSDLTHALDFVTRQEGWIAARLAESPKGTPFVPGASVPLRGRMLTITSTPALHSRSIRPDMATGRLLVGGSGQEVTNRVAQWLKGLARFDLADRVKDHAQTLNVRPLRLTVRDTRTRWGSCSSEGALSFSWRLIMAPPEVLDYVAAHEVAHLVHHDHSPAFWAVVRDLHGDPGGASAWLKREGAALHRYGAL